MWLELGRRRRCAPSLCTCASKRSTASPVFSFAPRPVYSCRKDAYVAWRGRKDLSHRRWPRAPDPIRAPPAGAERASRAALASGSARARLLLGHDGHRSKVRNGVVRLRIPAGESHHRRTSSGAALAGTVPRPAPPLPGCACCISKSSLRDLVSWPPPRFFGRGGLSPMPMRGGQLGNSLRRPQQVGQFIF